MKAAQITAYGGADNIQIVDVATPTITADQVLIEAHASSLNPFDTMVREGYVKDALPPPPFTLGGDIAGVVTEVGANVQHVAVGDTVYGQAHRIAGNSGAFADFVATSGGQVARVPKNIDLVEAAALPLAGVSALQGLTEHITIQPGTKLFIHGGSGGIGSLAIQIAKAKGAYVATTATGEGVDYAKQLGADEVIDYKAQDFTTVLQDYDAVFDTVGQDDFVKSYQILRDGGVAVSMIAPVDEAAAAAKNITAFTQSTAVNTERLDELAALVESGTVKAQVGKTFNLNNIVEAFKARESQSVHGKIVITIK